MQTRGAWRKGLIVVLSLYPCLAVRPVAAQDHAVVPSQTTAHRPLMGLAEAKIRPESQLKGPDEIGPGAALTATSARGAFASTPIAAVPQAQSRLLVSQSMHDTAPDITGRLPKQTSEQAMAPGVVETATPGPMAAAPAEPPAAPTQAAPAVAPTPVTFAERLHLALEAWAASELKGRGAAEAHKLRAAILAYYAGNDYAPLWIEQGKPNAAAQAVLVRLVRAKDDGLAIDNMPVLAASGGEDELIATEIALSAAVVDYGRQASGSRIDPIRIATLIGAKPTIAEPVDILASVSAAGTAAGTVLQNFNPPQPGYRALRDKLAELRQAKPMARQEIPAGPVLKVGMRDPRVPLIRARFGLDSADAESDAPLLYDTKIAAAVAQFQKESGLPASGRLTARTIAALSQDIPANAEDEIIANMEIWRWMPRDLGGDRIEVNIPDFNVSVFRGDQLVARNKVVVGKPDTPTPVFSNAMRFLIVNPVWNIPPSIIRKEFNNNPSALRQHGYEVAYVHGHLVARQAPGERNALGRIKFMFPNDYAVYLHDTPSRALFGQSQRAFSHGCVRVDLPFDFAHAVMGPDSPWPEERLKKLIGGGKERYVNLPAALPIHIEYFTAFVDASGQLQLRKDIYGYTHKIEIALGLEKPAPEKVGRAKTGLQKAGLERQGRDD